MFCGGYAPVPLRCGGGTPLVQIITESLNQQRGTAYDTSSVPGAASPVYIENLAIAREIAGMRESEDRLALITDPLRTCALARWEKIYAIYPPPNATEYDRHLTLAATVARVGAWPSPQALRDTIKAALGPAYVKVVTLHLEQANASTTPWRSTLSHVLVQVQTPPGWTEAMFQDAVAKLGPIFDWMIPAHALWDWYRNGPAHSGTLPQDSGAGFFLDERNLDNEIFDV